MNKKFFNGRRKKKKRKTRKMRGGVYCPDFNTKKECLEKLPYCYWKPINLKHYSGTKMSKYFGKCEEQKERKVLLNDDARIRRKKRISNKTKSKSKNRTPSQILKSKSKGRADILIDMMDDFKKFDTRRVNSCCTISGGRKKTKRKKRGGYRLKLHELKLNEVYIVSIHGKFMNKEMILEKIVKPYPERAPNFIKYYFKDASNENWTFNLHTLLDPYEYTIRKPFFDITANIKNLLNQGQGRRKKKTRRKRRKKRDEGGVADTIIHPLIIGDIYYITPEDASDNSERVEGTLLNLNPVSHGVYVFLVGAFIKKNKENTDIIAVNRIDNSGSGRRKKKTRRKRRKKRDNAGCLPWRRRRRKKTKKIKTPSIEQIIKKLEKSKNPTDKKIAEELNLTLGSWR